MHQDLMTLWNYGYKIKNKKVDIMKKVLLKKLSKDERNELLRAFTQFSEAAQAKYGSAEKYLEENDNQTFLAISAVINSQAWNVDATAMDILELKKLVEDYPEAHIIVEDRHVKAFLTGLKTAKILGTALEAVVEVSENFKNAVDFDPNKK